MARPLPKQLGWSDFVRAIRRAGYEGPLSRGNGSIRHFTRKDRMPFVVTVHEPHPQSTIPPGSLRAYVEKFKLTNDEFLDLLEG